MRAAIVVIIALAALIGLAGGEYITHSSHRGECPTNQFTPCATPGPPCTKQVPAGLHCKKSKLDFPYWVITKKGDTLAKIQARYLKFSPESIGDMFVVNSHTQRVYSSWKAPLPPNQPLPAGLTVWFA